MALAEMILGMMEVRTAADSSKPKDRILLSLMRRRAASVQRWATGSPAR